MPEPIIVTLTDADLEKQTSYNDQYDCILAQAIKREIGPKSLKVDGFGVLIDEQYYDICNGEPKKFAGAMVQRASEGKLPLPMEITLIPVPTPDFMLCRKQ